MTKYFTINRNKTFHREGCHHLRGKKDHEINPPYFTWQEAVERRYKPCRVCLEDLANKIEQGNLDK